MTYIHGTYMIHIFKYLRRYIFIIIMTKIKNIIFFIFQFFSTPRATLISKHNSGD